MRFRMCVSMVLICALAGSLCAQNLVQNGGFDDASGWTAIEHTVPAVTTIDLAYADDAPALGAAPCLRIAATDVLVSRPLVYQKLTLVAGQEYMVSVAMKIVNMTGPNPPGAWFQLYMTSEEPPPTGTETQDWNPPFKLLNVNAWGGFNTDTFLDLVGADGLLEEMSASSQIGDNTGLYIPPGEAGTEVDIWLTLKPGQWRGNNDGVGSYEVLFDNVSVTPLAADELIGLPDITVADDAIVSLLYDGTEYVVADGDLTLGTTTRWYLDAGAETLWAEGDPAPAATVSGTSNPKEGDVGSKADNFLLALDGGANISSIDGIDFQETVFPVLSDTFFLLERCCNDAGTWQAIYGDNSLGEEVAFDKASNGGPYAQTAFNSTDQAAYGVVFKTVEPAMGVRITASGHDTISISIPTPAPLQVAPASAAPVIDGELDAVWDDVESTQCLITDIVNADSAMPEGPEDLSASFKVMYDADNFYIFVEVQDSVLPAEFSTWQGDGVEIYFDGDNSKGATYDGVNDTQIRITADDVELADIDSALSKEGTAFKVMITDTGYNVEASFPLNVLQITPGNVFGFEVQVNDNDGGGRETMSRWYSNNNDSWKDASLFGEAVLAEPAAVDGPIGAWNLDEGAGDIAADNSGNGLDGVIAGALWVSPGSDGMGSCLEFDGIETTLVDLGNFDVTTGSGLTIALWCKADNLDTPGSDPRMFSKAIGGSTQDHWFMVSSSRTGADKVLRFRLKTDGSTGELKADASTGLIDLDVWMHVAAVWDGAAMKLYKNGLEVASVEKGGVLSTNPDANVAIGNQPVGAPGRPWDGLIDDVRLYDRGLSADEILELAGQ